MTLDCLVPYKYEDLAFLIEQQFYPIDDDVLQNIRVRYTSRTTGTGELPKHTADSRGRNHYPRDVPERQAHADTVWHHGVLRRNREVQLDRPPIPPILRRGTGFPALIRATVNLQTDSSKRRL